MSFLSLVLLELKAVIGRRDGYRDKDDTGAGAEEEEREKERERVDRDRKKERKRKWGGEEREQQRRKRGQKKERGRGGGEGVTLAKFDIMTGEVNASSQCLLALSFSRGPGTPAFPGNGFTLRYTESTAAAIKPF